ncbi:tetratricopeptide repeat protein [Phormidium tenue FACHB-886]|nr:tetratricopeptide repeat protein [Phormidium tenue FACHB-886]
MLPEQSEPETALELLKARGLAEEEWEEGAWLGADDEIPLRQHNLIRSVGYERLKADEAIWQAAERRAAEQWLNHYEAAPEVANLEKVRGYLEAFDHYCDVKDYQIAHEIPYRLLETKNEVYWQLFIWGYYRKLIPLHNKRLFVAHEIADRQGEGIALGNLGLAYYKLGNYTEAIEYHQQSLAIARDISDRRGESNALGNLGIAYDSLGDYTEAIEYHQQSLAIARDIGDRRGEGNALGNLGIAYYSLGNYTEAIEYHQQHLAIAREIGNRQGEGNALVNWGCTLIRLEQCSEALEYLQASLEIFQEIGDREGEAEALLRLAELHQKIGSIELARQECARALAIATELGIPLVKECEALKQQLEEEGDGSDR